MAHFWLELLYVCKLQWRILRKDLCYSSGSSRVSRQTSWSESKSRTVSGASGGYVIEGGSSAPMMKVIGQLWCHECTRMFADRLVSPDGGFKLKVLFCYFMQKKLCKFLNFDRLLKDKLICYCEFKVICNIHTSCQCKYDRGHTDIFFWSNI